MTRSEMVERARRLARASAVSIPDEVVIAWLDEALTQFSKDTGGLEAEAYLAIEPHFDILASHAFTLSVEGGLYETAGVLIRPTDTDRHDLTGVEVAALLADALRTVLGADEDVTVEWSPTTMRFIMTIPEATSIGLSSPESSSYRDLSELLFAGALPHPSPLTGGAVFPNAEHQVHPECTVYARLPQDFYAPISVLWRSTMLRRATNDLSAPPAVVGRPFTFMAREGRLWLYPAPARDFIVHLRYWSRPEAIPETGELASLAPEWHMGLVYYAASKLAEESFEYEVGSRMYASYMHQVRTFRQQRANANPAIPFARSRSVFDEFAANIARRS